ncbi:hypothetical protein PpBr36_01044 [Pyricularia pennisetigena]|uniref:hypothetical protein n=1 Tax=Pyricularia pennisetigena TaxID=1578925 RepID=UPI00114E6675|nr:hypothetical protein PpBr36_01044 [Pyricularia pennisetigena]TLS28763.1 hypothetical protein PpBr36_01044 [Pyricularia pennisetigena]
MAPPHLHPRSRMTSSLFATTVVASFFVVALPHVLPCPAPRRVFADGDMETMVDANGRTLRRRRRMPLDPEVKDGIVQFDAMSSPIDSSESESESNTGRACPIPKPGGKVGELLGFTRKQQQSQDENKTEVDRGSYMAVAAVGIRAEGIEKKGMRRLPMACHAKSSLMMIGPMIAILDEGCRSG